MSVEHSAHGGRDRTLSALGSILLWLALSIPLGLLVARTVRVAGGDDVGDEAERWLRRRTATRGQRIRSVIGRSTLATALLAPVVVGAAVAAWRAPALLSVTRTDGQLALSWLAETPTSTTASEAPSGTAVSGAVSETVGAPAYVATTEGVTHPAAATDGPAPATEAPPAVAEEPEPVATTTTLPAEEPPAPAAQPQRDCEVDEHPADDADDAAAAAPACEDDEAADADQRIEKPQVEDDAGRDGETDTGTTSTTVPATELATLRLDTYI